MDATLTSLLWIALIGFLAPVISFLIPHRVIPEAVLLIVGGMIIGPFGIQLAHTSQPLHLLSELGVGFLFLLAGYEIEPKEVANKTGLGAFIAWLLSISAAFAVVMLWGAAQTNTIEGVAIAIAMSATALGTILPIIKDRKITDTPTGHLVLAHGAMGEIGPIMLMALLLSINQTWQAALILLAFSAVALLLAIIPQKAQNAGLRLVKLVHFGSSTTAQTTVRIVVMLLVGIIAFAASLGIDIVLGAFAAGIIVRQALPDGRYELEQKLDGLAFGFFIPTFFIISGMEVNYRVLFDSPAYLFGFLALLLLVRGLPIFLTLFSTTFLPQKAKLPLRERAMVGIYCTTNLPIIVAVTQIAVNSHAMSKHSASILVTAGLLSVLLMPLLAKILQGKTPLATYRSWKQNHRLKGQTE